MHMRNDEAEALEFVVGRKGTSEFPRQSGNLASLRLFVDLYAAQSLARDSGIDWRQLRRRSERTKVGEYGPYVIFGFELGALQSFRTAPFVVPHLTGKTEKIQTDDGKTAVQDTGWVRFWDALRILTDTGLVQIVEHLVEGHAAESEIVHPYGISGGEEQERELAVAANSAGLAMLAGWRRDRADENPDQWLVPVLAHMIGVELVGVFRMKYRPRTKATAAWFVGKRQWAEWTRHYEELERKAKGEADRSAAAT
jgi:hypothetical protein